MIAVTARAAPAEQAATTPVPHRVIGVRPAARGCVTLDVEESGAAASRPGQFDMVSVLGVGEAAISISSHPAEAPVLSHTVRGAGWVTDALCALRPGDVVGVRGPYGRGWPVDAAVGRDLVLVAGGIGLAPLRPALLEALHRREEFGRVVLLLGARTPEDLLYTDELDVWRDDERVELAVTVDVAGRGWFGPVGLVTRLLDRAGLDPSRTTLMTCGPPVMMTAVARAALALGVEPDRLHVSLERNMRCGVGTCGHCQVGTVLVCRDGPVFPWPEVARLLEVREL